MNVESLINNVYNISPEAVSKLSAVTTIEEYPKGYVLFESGKIEHATYFILQGIVRGFYYQDGDDVTFWFGREGDPVISMKNYIENKPSYENIELLEDSVLLKINNSDLVKLYSEDIHISNWGRKLAEKQLIKTEEIFISRLFKTAKQRYIELLEHDGDLVQRVQLGHIASYLGITQVSLSRIRSELR